VAPSRSPRSSSRRSSSACSSAAGPALRRSTPGSRSRWPAGCDRDLRHRAALRPRSATPGTRVRCGPRSSGSSSSSGCSWRHSPSA
jgi:hypothetical protein